MNNEFYIGQEAKTIEIGRELVPISRITLYGENGTSYTLGDDSGYHFEVSVPLATESMAYDIYIKARGRIYQGYKASCVTLPPEVELGDIVNLQGVRSVIAYRDFYFTPKLTSTIQAPYEEEVDHEYSYEGTYKQDLSNKVAQGAFYYGTRITRQKGLEIIKQNINEEQKSRVILNSDILAFYNDNGQEAFYFDSTEGVFKISQYANVEDALEGSAIFSTLQLTAEGLQTSVENTEGKVTQIDQTVNNISFSVSDPIAGQHGSYVELTLSVGDNSYHGVVMVDGNVDITGSLSASELYASYGSVADLEVNRLSTSRRIPKYLFGDTSDDQYINISDQHIYFMQGIAKGGTEQALNPIGSPLYWEQDVSDAFLGTDGYPYIDSQRVFTTTEETDWPVLVYSYDEKTKLCIEYEQGFANSEPRVVFGAGLGRADENIGKGFIQKTSDEFDIWYRGSDGVDRGMYIDNTHTHIVGLPKTTSMDFSNWDSGIFTESLSDGVFMSYSVTFDSHGNPIKITDSDGNSTVITW